MTDRWIQIADNRWHDEVQSPRGKLTVEIIKDTTRQVYSVSIQGTAPNEGLTIPTIHSLEEAKELGEALITQFTNNELPTIEEETKPLDPPWRRLG